MVGKSKWRHGIKLTTTKTADYVGGPVGTRIGFDILEGKKILSLPGIEPQYLCRSSLSSLILISVPTMLSGLNRKIPCRSEKYFERTFHFNMKNVWRSVHFFYIGLTVLKIIKRITLCGATSCNSCILNEQSERVRIVMYGHC